MTGSPSQGYELVLMGLRVDVMILKCSGPESLAERFM